ncbi:MAG: TIGR00266 family protein [SAR202 cluster bacterium]|nr:TIGR00266 family protein [SAR202 cluster bacterium]
MKYTVQTRPSYSLLETELQLGEELVAESGAMVYMTPSIKMQTSTRGGIMKGLKRMVLAGESFFQNTYRATDGPGVIGLAPGQPGDIVVRELTNGELILERNAYMASTTGIVVDSSFQGLKGILNEGLFVLRCTGTGTLFFNAYGAVDEVEVNGSYIVDSGHAVAWEPTLQWQLTRARRVRAFIFGDQLLLRFNGRGRLWVQSRNPQSLANWVYPFRPVQRDNEHR